MQAMILAAGFGTRMSPLSDTTPKAALPLMGRPLIAHTLEWLLSHGVDRAIINLHHLPDTVRLLAESHTPPGLDLRFVREPEIRGTGGGLVGARGEFEPGPVIVVNGDIYTDMDLGALAAAHAEHGALATLALNAHPDQFELFSVGLAGDAPNGGPITDFWGEPSGGDPKRRLAFTGVHIVEPELINSLPVAGFSCIKEAGYLPALREGHKLYGQIMEGAWFDLGTPARYLGAHARLMDEAGTLSGLPEIAPRVWSNAPIPMGVNVCPPVVLGEKAQLHLGSTVGPNVVLGARSQVKPGASVINSVVWDDAIIEEAVWDAIVSTHAVVKNPEADALTSESLA